ncbi:hypothetical protein CCR75_000814 [Bremia lactucae]|uniref:Uncharacterized protein n=1 Tax=Bremia lactucae TaxID=4779 RepID=A0A976IC66_BRELC|nr:hypothetical protein CCR75_000814 [Bremia lactucae]
MVLGVVELSRRYKRSTVADDNSTANETLHIRVEATVVVALAPDCLFKAFNDLTSAAKELHTTDTCIEDVAPGSNQAVCACTASEPISRGLRLT